LAELHRCLNDINYCADRDITDFGTIGLNSQDSAVERLDLLGRLFAFEDKEPIAERVRLRSSTNRQTYLPPCSS
jgi:hypothetical protein